jgi:hypothetical protein
MRAFKWMASIVLVLAALAVALGATGEGAGLSTGQSQGYKYDRQTALLRTNVAVVDSAAATATYANALLAHAVYDNGTTAGGARQNLTVSPRFSVASANCKIRVLAFNTISGAQFFLGATDEQFVVAHATQQDGSSRYVASTVTFDTFGASALFVVVSQAPSSGVVSFAVGSH